MSRYHNSYHSPYAAPRHTSRLPWLIGLLIVAAFVAVGGVLARGQFFERVNGLTRPAQQSTTPTAPALAAGQAAPPTTQTGAATAGPTATVPTGSGPVTTAPAVAQPPAATTAPPAVAATAQPATTTRSPAAGAAGAGTPGKVADLEPAVSPRDVVTAYIERWSTGDYEGLYDLVSAPVQGTITRQAFVDRYKGIADEAGLTTVKATITGEPNLQTAVPIHVEMESSRVGKFAEDNAVPLVKESGAWKVNWTPSLILKDLGDDGCVEYQAEMPERGKILDRNGKPLAVDGQISRVGIVPEQITDERTMLTQLSKLLAMKPEEIKAKYADAQPNWFVPIKDYPEQMDDQLLNSISTLEGVAVHKAKARVYPLGAKAADITGYLSPVTEDDLNADTTGTLQAGDLIGRAGLEAGANELLTGKPGGKLAIVACDSRGTRTTLGERKPVPAKDLILTIDADFQIAVDATVGNVRGAAVVLDPRTGAVLALVSHPSYDPNWFILGFSDKDWKYVNDPNPRPLLNRAAEAAYPTGSIFKVITMSAAMEHLGYTGESEIECPQEFHLPGSDQVWKDWTVDEGLGAQGTLTLHTALVSSCNTVFYQLGAKLDAKDPTLLPNMAKAFGLGKPTGIPYLPEVGGTVPDPDWKRDTIGDGWATGDAVNLAIGQGFLAATPLQMATAYAALANGGSVLQPYIVDMTQDVGGTTTQVGKRTVTTKLPLDKATIREIRSALRDQTSTEGTGSYKVFSDFDYPIAGKTGTAQNERNRAAKPHAWFAAFGPYGETATITSTVIVESVGEGVTYAAPITRQIFQAYLDSDLPKKEP